MALLEHFRNLRKTNPVVFGYWIGGLVVLAIVLSIGIFSIWRWYWNDTFSLFSDSIVPVATISTLIVLVTNAMNNFYLQRSVKELHDEVTGSHKIYQNFKDHLDELIKKIRYKGNGKTVDMTFVLSSIAYGIRSGVTKEDKENAKTFINIINSFLDDAEVLNKNQINTTLRLYMWDEAPHLQLFGAGQMGTNLDEIDKKIICEDIVNVIERISALKQNNCFSVTVYKTKRLDWRLFMYRKEREEYGMTAIFTPLSKAKWLPGDWSFAAYSSDTQGIGEHCSSLITTLNKDGAIDITSIFLDPKKFIKMWFDIDCNDPIAAITPAYQDGI